MRDSGGFRGSTRRRGLATRLLLMILAVSSLVTLISTAAQLYLDYRRDVVAIEGRLDEIERGNLDSIAGSLWNVDTDQLRLQMEGLLRLPDMRFLDVREADSGQSAPIVLTVGTPGGQAVITRTMALMHSDGQGIHRIGTLVATASLDGVYSRLFDRVAVILLTQFVKTLIVSTFIFYIVHLTITRHITAIADHFRAMGTEAESPPLCLARRQKHADELDDMVGAFNALTHTLHESYAQVSRANESLQAARSLADARAVKLEDANRELRRLALVTAHHLQEPLRPMAMGAQRVAQLTGATEGELAEWCGALADGTTHLGALLRDFQRYVAALTDDLRLAPCDMGELAHRSRSRILEAHGESCQARIEIAPLPGLIADEHKIAQVLDELLDNALRHGRPGVPPVVRISASFTGREWEFVVADNGPGFDAAIAERVFEVFEVARDRAPDRTGLGLPMCRAILRAHGGRILAEPSGVGVDGPQGGIIRFTLPVRAVPT